MSETASQEPTMEEILASIRRIISEDDTPAEPGAEVEAEAAAAPVAEPEPVIEPLAVLGPGPEVEAIAAPPPPVIEPLASPAPLVPLPDLEDDLELTQKVETSGDLDILSFEDASPPPPPVPPLVSETVAAAAAASFGHLSASIAMPASERTLEDVVRSLLTPLLQQWLDANLPGIVQEAVQTEVDRIARSRVR